MLYFCTYFDQYYLPRGLALYESLCQQCKDFRLWVLCMDQEAYQTLLDLKLPGVSPVSLESFESGDAALKAAKLNRSRIEYYFTCTPSLPLYVLNNHPEVDVITYLDSDLWFFANPGALLEEMGEKSVAIIAHRFPPELKYLESASIYNVGWLSFRRDDAGITCLKWWRERCIEWCYDRLEDGRFADQKYLDDWPTRFPNVIVLANKGANLAPWNLSNYKLTSVADRVLVDDQPVIFFHFHGLKKRTAWAYDPDWESYRICSSKVLRRQVYVPYIRMIEAITLKLKFLKVPVTQKVLARGVLLRDDSRTSLPQKIKKILAGIKNTLKGNYIFVFYGRVF